MRGASQLAHMGGCGTFSPVTETGAALTIADAARATGTDRGSIRRRLQAGAFPEAFKDEQGFWRIPTDNLQAAGFECSEPPGTISLPALEAGSDAEQTATAPAASAIEALKAELETERNRADKAEALLLAERRLNEELGTALARERRTVEVLLEQVTGKRVEKQETRVQPPGPRVNWQAGLRAARARQLQERAARDRGSEAGR